MHVKRRVGDLDLAGKQKHRSHQQQDRCQKQHAGQQSLIKIGGDHRAKRQHEGDRRTALDDTDEAKPVA